MKYFITILFSILLLGCVSTYRYADVYEFDSKEGYIGIHLDRNVTMSLKNLDTDEIVKLDLKKKDSLIAFSIPEGDYAVTSLIYHTFSIFGSNAYFLEVPLYLKTIIEVRNESLTYLGNIDLSSKTKKGTFIYDYPFEETILQIETEYFYGPNFVVKPLEQLSLENIEESHFDFNM